MDKFLTIILFFSMCIYSCRVAVSTEELKGKWVHVTELDKENVKTYYPGYKKLSPLRGGRQTYTFKDNNIVTITKLGAADRTKIYTGKWSYNKKDQVLYLTNFNNGLKDIKLKILKLDSEILQLVEQ